MELMNGCKCNIGTWIQTKENGFVYSNHLNTEDWLSSLLVLLIKILIRIYTTKPLN